MKRSVLLGVLLTGVLAQVHPSQADPVPPACVVVDQPPLHVQVGYAPNGPGDCTALP
jgi:hypothetical protein